MFLIKADNMDVRVHGNKIVQVGANLELHDEVLIEAYGKQVLPGCIDPHVHFRDFDLAYKEDFKTGCEAAVVGGVTTVFDMPNSEPPLVDLDSLELRKKASENVSANMRFYAAATPENLDELTELVTQPEIIGIKAYLGSTTGNLLFEAEDLWDKLLSDQRETLVAVHSECECMINQNTQKFKDIKDPQIHSVIRGNDVAEHSTRKIIEVGFKYNARLHIAHMSTHEELFAIREYREKGYDNLTCEVAPHHLIFNLDDYEKHGTFLKCNPPIRSREDRNALWEDGIALGLVDMIATDHAPHTVEEKRLKYWDAPSGMPGVQEASQLLLNQVSRGEITLEKFVELRSSNVAKIFGLHDRGRIAQGCIADLILVDLEKQWTITRESLKSKCGWSNYEGRKGKGKVVMTMVAGKIVWEG